MKLLHNLSFVMFLALLAGGIASCGDDDAANNNVNNTNNQSNGTESAAAGDTYNVGLKSATAVNAFVTAPGTKSSIDDIIIDPALTPAENAQAMLSALLGNVDNACVTASVDDQAATLSADFDGLCPVELYGISMSGQVTLGVTVEGGVVTVAFVFTELAVDGLPAVSGTVTLTYSGTGNYELELDLSTSEVQITFTGTLLFDLGVFYLDCLATYQKNVVTYDLTIEDLAWDITECYPSAGVITLDDGLREKSVTFDENTPQSGEVELKIGIRSETITLPAYGSCP